MLQHRPRINQHASNEVKAVAYSRPALTRHECFTYLLASETYFALSNKQKSPRKNEGFFVTTLSHSTYRASDAACVYFAEASASAAALTSGSLNLAPPAFARCTTARATSTSSRSGLPPLAGIARKPPSACVNTVS